MRFIQVPKYREYNKYYKEPWGVNFVVKSKSVKNIKSPHKIRSSAGIPKFGHYGQDYIVQNYDTPFTFNCRTNQKNKLFRRFPQYGKTKKDENRVLSATDRRKEERQEAKLRKLAEKQQKLFRKSLLIEIDRFERIKKLKQLEEKNRLAEPVLIRAVEPFRKISPRKLKSATTQYDPKVQKIWSNRRKLLAIESTSKCGLTSKYKLKKREEKKKRRTPISKRFVNCFYRTCCRIYCCITFVLIVGVWVILFMPLS